MALFIFFLLVNKYANVLSNFTSFSTQVLEQNNRFFLNKFDKLDKTFTQNLKKDLYENNRESNITARSLVRKSDFKFVSNLSYVLSTLKLNMLSNEFIKDGWLPRDFLFCSEISSTALQFMNNSSQVLFLQDSTSSGSLACFLETLLEFVKNKFLSSFDVKSLINSLVILERLIERSVLTVYHNVIIGEMLEQFINRISNDGQDNVYTEHLLNIFCSLSNPLRKDEVVGFSKYLKLLEKLVNEKANQVKCDNILKTWSKCPENFGLYFGKIEKPHLKLFMKNVSKFSQIISFETHFLTMSTNPELCCAVELVQLNSDIWIQRKSKFILASKITVFHITSNRVPSKGSVVFKIPLTSEMSDSIKIKCGIWIDESWTDSYCNVVRYDVISLNDSSSMFCNCSHMSTFSSYVTVDPSPSSDDRLIIYISESLSIVSHLICLMVMLYKKQRNTFFTILFAFYLILGICIRVTYVINIVLSPTVLFSNIAPNLNVGCIIISIILYASLTFTCGWPLVYMTAIFNVQAINNVNSKNRYCTYVLVGMGIPITWTTIVIIGVTLYVKFSNSLTVSDVIGDVNSFGFICFIKDVIIGTCVVIIPVVIIFFWLIVLIVISLCRIRTWKSFDDIYLGSRNITEFILLIFLWFLNFLLMVFGGLTIVTNNRWTIFVFCAVEIAEIIYMVICFFIRRLVFICSLNEKSRYKESANQSYNETQGNRNDSIEDLIYYIKFGDENSKIQETEFIPQVTDSESVVTLEDVDGSSMALSTKDLDNNMSFLNAFDDIHSSTSDKEYIMESQI